MNIQIMSLLLDPENLYHILRKQNSYIQTLSMPLSFPFFTRKTFLPLSDLKTDAKTIKILGW